MILQYSKHGGFKFQAHEKFWRRLSSKNLGEYHNSYVQNNKSLLADVIEDIQNKCHEI